MNCQYCNCPVPPGAAQCPACGAQLQNCVQQQAPEQWPQESLQPVGSKFQLMPGERLLVKGNFNKVGFGSNGTYMRLTDRRLVLCDKPWWMSLFIGVFVMLVETSKITKSFTRSDIALAEIKPYFWNVKKLVITDRFGKTYNFFGDHITAVQRWWQTGNI